MSKLNHASPEQIDRLRSGASAMFAPVMLREALQRLSKLQGSKCLDEFEKSMERQIEGMQAAASNLDDMKELAIEQLHTAIADVRAHPDNKHDLENTGSRRAEGRSEEAETLEQQLQSGLEDTFPASDPPAVVSTTISGRAKKLTGVEEHLRNRRPAKVRH